MTENTKPPTALDPDGTMPTLEGWLTLNEAAEILGVSRQRFYALMRDYEWTTARRLGSSRTVVVHVNEVLAFKASRDKK